MIIASGAVGKLAVVVHPVDRALAGLADEILTPGEGQVRGMRELSAYRPAPELEICLLRTHVAAFPPIGLSCLDARRRAARESKVR